MGLYLCVFADPSDDEELEGVEVGSYADFGAFREAVAALEPDGWGTRFPVLMSHEDADGQWSAEEAVALAAELVVIASEFSSLPPVPSELARKLGVEQPSLRESFLDVDGELLLDRLLELAHTSARTGLPIWFQ